jgi:arginine exporter protein ArgO
MDAFWRGILAGYGIAIPVGAIAVLIIEAGLRRGFRVGFMAGAGAATADLVYASLAAIAGQALAAALAPLAAGLRLASGLVLVGLGGWGLWRIWKNRPAGASRPAAGDPAAEEAAPSGGPAPILKSPLLTYTQFGGLTLLNPLTITDFAARILGGGAGQTGWANRLVFVAGAALASLSWQSLLAGLGALAHRRLPPGIQAAASLLGNLIVAGLGIQILVQALF